MVKPALILCLHGIGTPPSTAPADERPYWITEDNFTTLIAGLARSAAASDVTVQLTFDDGNLSDIAIAAPALRRHGLTAGFFPCTSRIGRAGYLGAHDLRALADQGFEIGSHGVDHVRWATLEPPAIEREVGRSKVVLEDVLGRAVTSAAIPFGSYDRRVLASLKKAGYRTVYTSDRGFANAVAWRKRRWTYTQHDRPDISRYVAESRSARMRLLGGLKSFVKAIR